MKSSNGFFLFTGIIGGTVIAQQQPNVVLILADDLGCNDLTCYRNTHNRISPAPPTSKTPNIDKLAAEGIRFTNFYCGAAVSSPSRASLITGRNCTRLGIYNWVPANSPMHLRASEITIAEMLKSNGYNTAHFGKWHLTSIDSLQPIPNGQGYDYSFWSHNNAEPSHKDPVSFLRNNKPVGKVTGYSCNIVVDEAQKWLAGRDKNKPFYIDVWFNEPHDICAAPEELTSRHQYNKEYYGCIENMDIAIGRLMKYLRDEGLDKNTVIMFSSDNGSQVPYSNYPVKGKKGINLQGGVRVPFIAWCPGKFPAGVVSNAVGSFTDILPTVAGLSGAAVPTDRVLDGQSLAGVFTKPIEAFNRGKPVFFYRYFHDPICFLREGDWNLLGYEEWFEYTDTINTRVLAKFKPRPDQSPWAEWGFNERHMMSISGQEPKVFELYNLKDDMNQLNNVADQHPDIVKKMKEKMIALKNEMVAEGGDWFKR